MDVFKEADVNADELIERYISMYRSLCQDDTGLAQEIDMQRTRRDLAEKKKSKLLEYNVTGQITDADFLKMNRQCDEEIEQCSRSLSELEEQQNSRADLNAHIAEIQAACCGRPRRCGETDSSPQILSKIISHRSL